jgi:hypothetical protein
MKIKIIDQQSGDNICSVSMAYWHASNGEQGHQIDVDLDGPISLDRDTATALSVILRAFVRHGEEKADEKVGTNR